MYLTMYTFLNKISRVLTLIKVISNFTTGVLTSIRGPFNQLPHCLGRAGKLTSRDLDGHPSMYYPCSTFLYFSDRIKTDYL